MCNIYDNLKLLILRDYMHVGDSQQQIFTVKFSKIYYILIDFNTLNKASFRVLRVVPILQSSNFELQSSSIIWSTFPLCCHGDLESSGKDFSIWFTVVLEVKTENYNFNKND